MATLKVTIRLSTPMAEPGELFHLDALLGALRVVQERQRQGDGINPRDYHHDLPLERYESASGQWVFKASAFRLQRLCESSNWMQTGRLNIAEAARHRAEGFLRLRAAKPNPAGGPFKTSLYHFPLAWADLTAYCVGDADAISALLADCKQVGGRRGVGFGQVSEISVEAVPEAECRWFIRALPEDADCVDLSQYAMAVSCLAAPYWDRGRQQVAWVPTGR